MCFAYKVTKAITTLSFTVQNIQGNSINGQANLNTTADFHWHYVCVDLYAALRTADSTFTTAASQLTLLSVN